MFANIRRYLVALTVVIALAVAYQSFVTPRGRLRESNAIGDNATVGSIF